MNANKSLAILLVVATVLAVSSLLVFKLVDSDKKPEFTESVEEIKDEGGVQEDKLLSQTPIEIRTSSTEWVADNQYDVDIAFRSLPDPTPTALTLQVLFDPSAVRVDDVLPGELWSEVNMLQKDIDNDNGVVLISIGQGFGSEITGKLTAVVLEVTAQEGGSQLKETVIRLGPESAQASVGVSEFIYLNETSVTVNIK